MPMAQSGFMSNRNEETRSKEKGIRVRLRGDMVLIKSKKNELAPRRGVTKRREGNKRKKAKKEGVGGKKKRIGLH